MPKTIGKTISDRVLGAEQNLVLAFYESTKTVNGIDSLRVGKAAFFKVRSSLKPFNYGPFTLIGSGGAKVGPLAANTGTDYQHIYRSADADLFENDEPWVLYHYAISVQQPHVRVYPSIPDEARLGGFTYTTAGHPDPTAPDDYGYLPGWEMNFKNPPAELENVAWKTGGRGSDSDIAYGFYNGDSRKQVDPILYLKGRAYAVEPISSTSKQNRLLTGREPRTIISLGPVHRPADFDIPNEWTENNAVMDVKGPIGGR